MNAGHFWRPENFENMAYPYFKNLNRLQNLVHFLLTEYSIYAVLFDSIISCHRSTLLLIASHKYSDKYALAPIFPF